MILATTTLAHPAAVALSVGLITGLALGAVWGYRVRDLVDRFSLHT